MTSVRSNLQFRIEQKSVTEKMLSIESRSLSSFFGLFIRKKAINA